MTTEQIISGSKLIAEYLGWRYIAFNDLQGFPKAGWWKVSQDNRAMLAKYVGWIKVNDFTAKFVCRKHSELRFWNSMDALIPVMQKIEKEYISSFILRDNGCEFYDIESYDLPNWEQNTFKVITKYLYDKNN